VILDGINDQGLSVGLFYFPNYAKYTNVAPANAKQAIAPHEFGMWVLANFVSVDEVKEGVKDIVVGRLRRRARQPARHRRRRAFLHSGQDRKVDRGRAGRRRLEGA
jgi:penicillin V acylase-like amidase (Ntn superfamily)